MAAGDKDVLLDKPSADESHEGEHHGDYGSSSVPISYSVRLYAICASVNSCNLGFDIGVSTNLGPLIQNDLGLTNHQREILIGSLNFFAMWGALASHFFSDRYGRRATFVVASFSFLWGLVIMALGQTYEVILAGRVLIGLGVGVGFAVDPTLYISEISPAKHRGRLVNWSEIGINIGVTLGFSMGLVFSDLEVGDGWRHMCLVGMVFPNRHALYCRWHFAGVPPLVLILIWVIEDIKEAAEREQMAEHYGGWGIIFHPSPAIRRMLLLGILVPVTQQASGVDAIQYYLLDLMEVAGVAPKKTREACLIGYGLLKLVGMIICGQLLLDRMGRRFTFFVSLTGIISALVILSVSFSVSAAPNSYAVLFGMALFLFSYGLGLGPACWLVPSEIFATCIRAKGVSITTFLNRGVATLMVTSFLSIKETITWSIFFLILAGFCLFTLTMIYLYLPETRGRSLEDMSLYFAEVTGDFSILDAERQLRVESDLKKMKDGKSHMKDETARTSISRASTRSSSDSSG